MSGGRCIPDGQAAYAQPLRPRAAVESLVDLLPLLFIGLYYLLAGRRRAKQKRAQAPQKELISDREPRAATPFQSFLGQLEEAMAEAAGEPVERTTPAPPSDPAPVERPSLSEDTRVPRVEVTDAEFRPTVGSFDSATPVDHAAHGFGRDNPLSEESFERAPAFTEPPRARSRDYDPHGLRPARPRPTPSAAAGWRQRLADPEAAQNAFVLQTVFGPRGGRRAEHRR